MKNPFAFVVLYFSADIFVEGLGTCKPDVIRKISERNRGDMHTNLIQSLHKITPFTYHFNPHGGIPPTVKCAKGAVDCPSGGKATARVIVEYNDPKKENLVINYQHEEASGYIKELDDNQNEFHIYVLTSSPCFCYYRCTPRQTDGEDFAACAAPIQANDVPAIQNCVNNCKTSLREVGVEVAVDDMRPCVA